MSWAVYSSADALDIEIGVPTDFFLRQYRLQSVACRPWRVIVDQGYVTHEILGISWFLG